MSADDSQSGGSGGSGNSFAAQHAVAPRHALNVAPTDGSTKFNTIRIPLIPVACWRLDDPGFAFDSSFVAPVFRDDVTMLREILQVNQSCPAALFGHCDPAGNDKLNKTLGDRRVIAVYALLTRQPSLWAYLYDNPEVGDTWGTSAIQCMLQSLVDADGHSYYPDTDTIDGKYGNDTVAAVKAFQADSGKPVTGQADGATRTVLFGAYMDRLSATDTASATDPQPDAPSTAAATSLMKPEDFLGGTGASQGDLPKMSLQSCGKLNPVVLLTTDEMGGEDTTDGASKTTRNADDAPNRRVVMFLFPQGTKVDTGVWPCPEVKKPMDACKSAFWPDGDQRRKNGSTLRVYSQTHDTMACRFYDRFARRSPCELGVTVAIWLQDRKRQRMPSAPYRLTVGTTTRTGNADGQGLATEKGLPVKTQCYVEWGTPIQDPSNGVDIYPYARFLHLDLQVDAQEKSLANLAYESHPDPAVYGTSEPPAASDMLAAFQGDYPSDTPQNVNKDGTPKKA
jgi:outer membrane protein OmpA-like peptidoglycan-associated protein